MSDRNQLVVKAVLQPQLRVFIFKVIASALLFSLTACSNHAFVNGIFPGPIFARNFPPPGPENYQSGMKDGCETAKSAASGVYGTFANGYVFNVNMGLNDAVYYKAWKDGYNYCKMDRNYYQS